MLFELPHFALELLVVLPCVQVGAQLAAGRARWEPALGAGRRCTRPGRTHAAQRQRGCHRRLAFEVASLRMRPAFEAALPVMRPALHRRRFCAAGCGSWRSRTFGSRCQRRTRSPLRLRHISRPGRGARRQLQELPAAELLPVQGWQMRVQAQSPLGAGCRM